MNYLKLSVAAQVFFLSLVIFTVKAKAQNVPQDMMERVKNIQISPENVVSDMKEKLGIDDDQAAKILPVIETQVTGMKEVMDGMSSGSIAPQDALTRIQALKDKTDSDLAQILTPDQMEKMKGLMHEGQEKANQMMQQGNFSSLPAQN